MTAEQESIADFRRNERVGPSKVYKCCECGRRTFGGLDMSPTDDGRDFCNDGAACLKRRAENKTFNPEIVNGVDCDGVCSR